MKLLPSSYAPRPPTELQLGLLRRIHEYRQQHNQGPSLVEMATGRANLQQLRLRGWATWDATKPRSLDVTVAGARLLAEHAAQQMEGGGP